MEKEIKNVEDIEEVQGGLSGGQRQRVANSENEEVLTADKDTEISNATIIKAAIIM